MGLHLLPGTPVLCSRETKLVEELLRLLQVFTAKGSELRQQIVSILSVKLPSYPDGQVHVGFN
ncbi:hypothetical protein BC628DRAFT_1420184 [Trametes gibbosa]|nr:hypothetical protein BC628DRAFT_1420184 [Trametes gibbosa]